MWKPLLLLCLFSGGLFAQHAATLTWTDSTNPTGTTYNAWRLTGTCPTTAPTTTSGFTQVNTSAIAAKTFTDSTVAAAATYCYVVTAVGTSGPPSAPSNDAQVIIPGAVPPTGLSVTAN
jgi:hypothetical protein